MTFDAMPAPSDGSPRPSFWSAVPATIEAKSETVRALVQIAHNNGGRLSPEVVVDAARDPRHPLHDRFTWDDTEAAHRYRLIEAGHLIRQCRVEIQRVQAGPHVISVRVFASLPSERGSADGSYMLTVDVMRDPLRRNELLQQAIRDLEAYRRRFSALEELGELMQAIDATLRKLKE